MNNPIGRKRTLQHAFIISLDIYEKEFEDTQGVIRIRKSKKNRHHNVQKKTDKKTNNDLQKIHIKPKIE